jgi:hypothetical protein
MTAYIEEITKRQAIEQQVPVPETAGGKAPSDAIREAIDRVRESEGAILA